MGTPSRKGKRTIKAPTRLVVEREFVGTKSIEETFIPIIVDDLNRKEGQTRTLDSMPKIE
jgi:hypothetical protein